MCLPESVAGEGASTGALTGKLVSLCLIQHSLPDAGSLMRYFLRRVPQSKRWWRLETELKEDGIISESESEVDETGVESEPDEVEYSGSKETHWASDESEEDPESLDSDEWDDERDWYLEN